MLRTMITLTCNSQGHNGTSTATLNSLTAVTLLTFYAECGSLEFIDRLLVQAAIRWRN
jgi:hypothetical protein